MKGKKPAYPLWVGSSGFCGCQFWPTFSFTKQEKRKLTCWQSYNQCYRNDTINPKWQPSMETHSIAILALFVLLICSCVTAFIILALHPKANPIGRWVVSKKRKKGAFFLYICVISSCFFLSYIGRVSLSDGSESENSSSPSPPSRNDAPPLIKTSNNQVRWWIRWCNLWMCVGKSNQHITGNTHKHGSWDLLVSIWP